MNDIDFGIFESLLWGLRQDTKLPLLQTDEFHQYIIRDMCGLVLDQLFRVGFRWVLWFPPTAIREMVKGLQDWIQKGSESEIMNYKTLVVCM